MPSKPKRPCKKTGCPELVESGFCESHSKGADNVRDRSKEAQERKGHYSTERWKKVRKRVLRRDPICQMCEEEPSQEVDHITPLAEGGDDSMENLQGLCESCHSKKTMRETDTSKQEYEYSFNTPHDENNTD